MDFPNLETIRAKDLDEIASTTALIFGVLPPGASVAVSGGATYRTIFKTWVKVLETGQVKLFPVDERIVPFASPDSNWGMIQRTFLDPLNWPQDKRCFVESLGDSAAQDYERVLRAAFSGPMPQFDVIFLGVGADGHTASLFPGSRLVDDTQSWVLRTQSPIPPKDRITLGMGAICAARQLVIILAGEEKKSVVRRMLEGDESLPIVKVLKNPVKKLVFLDHLAAEG